MLLSMGSVPYFIALLDGAENGRCWCSDWKEGSPCSGETNIPVHRFNHVQCPAFVFVNLIEQES